ncbi:MAG: anaerobic ribonucleoside-triphosphate reductase activating protein [Candidatus Bathyarchaeia archaeon]
MVSQGLPIVGIQRLSLSDYPGKICANLIIPGCNFRCPYCSEGKLIFEFIPMPKIPEDDVIAFLHPRLGFLDGVCITGGEPTIHRDLPAFLGRLKSIGSLVKLDTNGSHPGRLAHALGKKLVDYVAMDVKFPLKKYEEKAGYRITPEELLDSIQLIRRSGVDYEFRTTLVPGIVDEKDLLEIAETLRGSKRYVLQGFKNGSTLSKECEDVKPYSLSEMEEFRDLVEPFVGEAKLRF